MSGDIIRTQVPFVSEDNLVQWLASLTGKTTLVLYLNGEHHWCLKVKSLDSAEMTNHGKLYFTGFLLPYLTTEAAEQRSLSFYKRHYQQVEGQFWYTIEKTDGVTSIANIVCEGVIKPATTDITQNPFV